MLLIAMPLSWLTRRREPARSNPNAFTTNRHGCLCMSAKPGLYLFSIYAFIEARVGP